MYLCNFYNEIQANNLPSAYTVDCVIECLTVILEYFDLQCCLVDRVFWIFGVWINRVPLYVHTTVEPLLKDTLNK